MNILLVTPWTRAGAGGVETATRMLTRYLMGAGHEVITVTPFAGTTDEPIDWPGPLLVRRMRSPADHGYPFCSRLAYLATATSDLIWTRRLLRKRRIDVVNIHYPLGLFTNIALSCIGGPPLIVSAHGSDLAPVDESRPLDVGIGLALGVAESVICPSKAFANRIAARLPHAAGKIRIVPHGIKIPDDVYTASPWGRRYVLSVGGLRAVKNQRVLVRAFAKVAATVASVDLVIAGSGPLLGELTDQAELLGIADRVRFVGSQPPAAIDRWQRHAAVVVAPSPAETFGLAAAESMARGRPLVAARDGALTELVEDGVTGVLVSPSDEIEMAAAIVRLLNNPKWADALGRAGRTAIAERYTPAAMAAEYTQVFDGARGRIRVPPARAAGVPERRQPSGD